MAQLAVEGRADLLALAGWIAEWLVGSAGDAATRAAKRLMMGNEQTRALNQIVPPALNQAVDQTGAHLNRDQREHLRMALAERVGFQPGPDVAHLTNLREALTAWIQPLEDVGGYLSGMGIVPGQLAEVLADQIWQGIIRNTLAGGPLKPVHDYLVQQQAIGVLQGNTRTLDDISRKVSDLHERMPVPARAPVMFLPGKDSSFAGRDAVLQELRGKIDTHDPAGTVVAIHAIDGMAGVGKTALAVHVAHDHAGRYPDGALMVDLYGHTPGMAPLTAEAALARLLRQDGVKEQDIAADLGTLQPLWRSRMAPRQAIIVLDNALDSAQVRPLLPASAGCLVLITSRRRLVGLTEAIPLTVDVLGQAEAEALLARLVGADRAEDTAAIAGVVQMCGRLPLAIRIVAARLRHHPDESVAEIAAELSDARTRLDALHAEDALVAASIELSYTALPLNLQRAFVLCGLHPGPEITAEALAALGDVTVRAAGRWLRELADYHLADMSRKLDSGRRYSQHDLVRAFAQRLAAEQLNNQAEPALLRLVSDYLRRLDPRPKENLQIARMYPAAIASRTGWPWWTPGQDYATSEQANMLACAAACRDMPRIVGKVEGLLEGLGPFMFGRPDLDARTVYSQLRDIAIAAADDNVHLAAQLGLAAVELREGSFPAARDSFALVRKLAAGLPDVGTEIEAWRCLADTERLIGDTTAAADCHRRALVLATEANDPGSIEALEGLAELAAETGQVRLARELLQRAADLAGDTEDAEDYGLADVLWWSGELALLDGEPAIASSWFTRWTDLHRDEPSWTVTGLLALARSEAAMNELAAARAHGEQAYAMAVIDAINTDLYAIGRVPDVVQTLVRLPRPDRPQTITVQPTDPDAVPVHIAALEAGSKPMAGSNLISAERSLRLIAEQADEAGNLRLAAKAFRELGSVLAKLHSSQTAGKMFDAALARAEQTGDRPGQLGDLLRIDLAVYSGSPKAAWRATRLATELDEPLAELYALRRLAHSEWERAKRLPDYWYGWSEPDDEDWWDPSQWDRWEPPGDTDHLAGDGHAADHQDQHAAMDADEAAAGTSSSSEAMRSPADDWDDWELEDEDPLDFQWQSDVLRPWLTDSAIGHFLRAYELAVRVSSPDERADISLRIADIQHATGDLTGAAKHYRQACADAAHAVNAKLRARALHRLSRVQAASGDHEGAVQTGRQACDAYAGIGYRQQHGDALRELGDLEQRLGNTAAAREAWQAALACYANDSAKEKEAAAIAACLRDTT